METGVSTLLPGQRTLLLCIHFSNTGLDGDKEGAEHRVRLDGLARIFGKFLANSFSRVNATGGRIRNTRINTGDLWWAWVGLNHRPRPYQYCGR
jgi:hypothetical protein